MDFNRTWMLASSYRLGRPWIPIFKFWLIRPSMGPCHVLKFLPFKRSVDPFWKFGLIWPSVDPSLNSKWISRSWIPAFTLKNLDRFGRPWILASRCINPCILSGLWSMDINISDWAVHPFSLTGRWIPIFWPVHVSEYNLHFVLCTFLACISPCPSKINPFFSARGSFTLIVDRLLWNC